MQWADDVINFLTLTRTMEDTFGDRYIYTEWQGLMSQVFALLEEDDGGAAAAVKATMDACGIVLPGVSSSPRPSMPQAPQPDVSNHRVKRKASCDGRPAHGGGQASWRRPDKRARRTVCLLY